MSRAVIRLLVGGLLSLGLVVNVHAGTVTLEELKQHVSTLGNITGEFVQCQQHGSSMVRGVGRYVLVPHKKLTLDFDSPTPYRMEFFGDGTRLKTVGGIEQRDTRFSPISSLIFSLLNLRASVLEQQFVMKIDGEFDRFAINLTPKKRLKKLLTSIAMSGANGVVNQVEIQTKNGRLISIFFFPSPLEKEQSIETVCTQT